MGSFSESFRKTVLSKLGNEVSVLSGTSTQAVLSAINRYRSYLGSNTGVLDTITGIMAMDSDLIDDSFIQFASVAYDDDNPTFTEISATISDDFIMGLSEALHNGEDAVTLTGVTITDSVGHGYNIIDQRSNDIVYNGKRVLFAQTTYPSKLGEALVYQDVETGKLYLNNFIRTCDFVKNQAHRVRPDTIHDMCTSIYFMKTHIYDPNRSIMDCLFSFHYMDESNIYDYLVDLLVYYDLPYTSDIYNNIITLWNYCNETLYPLPTARGSINSIWSVIKDNYESSQLNSIILRTCNCILGGKNIATEITTIVAETTSNKLKSIKKFGRGISSAYNRGGVYGVACYIIEYIKELCTATTSDDGTMKFTDNSRFAPDIYLAGIISTIVNVGSALLSVIVSIFSRIAGVAIMIIGSVFSSIIKAIEYDSSATRAAINTDEDVIIPIAPYGMFQHNIPLSRITNEDLKSLLDQGETLFYLSIPGGFIIMGPGSFNDDGTTSSLNIEFHPSITDSGSACSDLIDKCIDDEILDITSPDGTYLNFSLNYLSPDDREEFLQWLSAKWNDSITDRMFENQPDDRLSNADDSEILDIITRNIFIMSVYTAYLCGYQTINDTDEFGLILFPGQSGHYIPEIPNNLSFTCGIWYALMHNGSERTIDIYTEDLGTLYQIDLNSGSGAYITWLQLSNQIIAKLDDSTDVDAESLINDIWYYDSVVTFNSSMKYAVLTPKYDASSFWAVLITTVVATALTVAAIAVTTYKVRKAIQMKRAINEARIASAYDSFTHDPNAETYNTYRKAVRKNNLWATLIGGSKYDFESYWHGSSNESGASSGQVSNPLSLLPDLADRFEIDSTVADCDSNIYGERNSTLNENIIRLIAGSLNS